MHVVDSYRVKWHNPETFQYALATVYSLNEGYKEFVFDNGNKLHYTVFGTRIATGELTEAMDAAVDAYLNKHEEGETNAES